MSSNIVNSQIGQPQSSKHMSTGILTQPILTEEPSQMDQYNKDVTTPRSYSSDSSSSIISNNNNTQSEKPQQPQPQQKQPPNSPSRTKKLVDKFATFSPRMKNKSDRQLIVETAYCNRNAKKDGTQSEQRPSKTAENVKQSRKKKRTINITEGMSRADIFAANVASAVDAAEDADEEDYIYSNDHSRTPSLTNISSGMPQPQLQPYSFPHMPSENNYEYPYHMPSNMYGTIPNSHRPYSNYLHRPSFYGYYDNSTSPNNVRNNYKPTGVMRSSLPDMSQYVSQYKKGYPNYGTTNYPYNSNNEYWYVDDERLPLFTQSYETRQRQSCTPTLSSLTLIVVFLLASSYLIYFASTRPLLDVSVTDVSNVLAADKELMFNIHVKGRNYGLWNIEIVNTDLNVFATPVNVPGGIPGGPGSHWDDVKNMTGEPVNEVPPSELLGSIFKFDEPLLFVAGFNQTGVLSNPSGQVRLRYPGGENDKEGQDRWSYIIRRQYDLTVRGVLKYSSFSKDHVVRVCYTTRVDGSSGSSTEEYDDKIKSNASYNIVLGGCGDWEKEQDGIIL